jgi:hypothetical protein
MWVRFLPVAFEKHLLYNSMTFAEYMELDEGVVPDRIVQWLQSTWQATKDQYNDTDQMFQTLQQKLASILGNNPKPTEQQLQLAMRAIGDLPKIGAVILGMVAPVPGAFAALMVIAYAFRKALGVSILPTHFEKAWMGANKLVDWNLQDYHQDDQAEIHEILTKVDQMYPVAGPAVSGLAVRNEVPNQGSIGSSVTDYQILPRIREFHLHGFSGSTKAFYSVSDQQRSVELAKQIWQSKQISPVIIVEEKGGPYILEGGHRVAALVDLKIASAPAMIVVDIDSFFD